MGLSWQHLLIILLIALVVFGAKRLRNIGSDLGAAVRGFKKAVNENEDEDEEPKRLKHDEGDAQFEEEKTARRRQPSSNERDKSA